MFFFLPQESRDGAEAEAGRRREEEAWRGWANPTGMTHLRFYYIG